MRILLKLTAAFLVVAVLVGVVGYSSNSSNQFVLREIDQLSRSTIVEFVHASEMLRALDASHIAAQQLLAIEQQLPATSSQQELADANRRLIADRLSSFGQSLRRNQQANRLLIRLTQSETDDALVSAHSQTVSPLLARMEDEFVRHQALMETFIRLTNEDLLQARQFLSDSLQTHYSDVMLPLIESYRHTAEIEFTRRIRGIEREIGVARYRNNLANLLALLVATGAGLTLSRSIARPLSTLKLAALRIGEGQLDTQVPVHSKDEIGVLAQTFNQMVADLRVSTVSRAYVDNILQSMNEMLIVVDRDNRIQKVNRKALEELGYDEQELVGQPLATLFPADASNEVNPSGLREATELRMVARSGYEVLVSFSAAIMRSDSGEVEGVVVVAQNIAARKLAEQRLRASLAEKEILLKEVHHRVKNNLQIISSLLNLQAREAGDPHAVRLFRDSQSRIRSMALIHEQLYQSEDLAHIDFSVYVRRLSEHLLRSSNAAARGIRIRVDVDAVSLPLDWAIPCGMIVNELVLNALEHAFVGRPSGEISITFGGDGDRYRLVVADNGIGMDPGSPAASNSLGLRIVASLVEQLAGELKIEQDGGTRFVISYEGKHFDSNPSAAPNSVAKTVLQ